MPLPGRAKTVLALCGSVCTVVGGVVIWKDMVAGEKYVQREDKSQKKQKNQEGKVFIVTGANTGLGKALAWELAWLQGKVYMACRDMRKCEEARKEIVLDTNNKYVYCRECDLTSLQSVRSFVKQFREKETRLDVLVNNAGVMNHPRKFSSDGVEVHLATNFLGHFLLTDLLLDMLREKKENPGRLLYLMNLDYAKAEINFEDLNSREKWDQTKAFRQSQLANMLLVSHLSSAVPPSEATVNAVYPGIVATNIKRHMGVDKSIVGTFISSPILWLMTRSPSRGVQTPLFASVDPGGAGDVTGKIFVNMKANEVDAKGKDEEAARKIFAVGKYWSGQEESKERLAAMVKNSTQS